MPLTETEREEHGLLSTVKSGQYASRDIEHESGLLDLLSKGYIRLFNLKDGACSNHCHAILGLTDEGEAELTRLEESGDDE